jgi:hypothetical protein
MIGILIIIVSLNLNVKIFSYCTVSKPDQTTSVTIASLQLIDNFDYISKTATKTSEIISYCDLTPPSCQNEQFDTRAEDKRVVSNGKGSNSRSESTTAKNILSDVAADVLPPPPEAQPVKQESPPNQGKSEDSPSNLDNFNIANNVPPEKSANTAAVEAITPAAAVHPPTTQNASEGRHSTKNAPAYSNVNRTVTTQRHPNPPENVEPSSQRTTKPHEDLAQPSARSKQYLKYLKNFSFIAGRSLILHTDIVIVAIQGPVPQV